MALTRPSKAINAVIFFFTVSGLILFPSGVRGQLISTACSSSLLSTFTPCFNFLTGSTNGGGAAPTGDCCTSLASLITTSAQCACLILTGNVPVSLPFINKTLAISLPSFCGSKSVPLQCSTAVGAPLPGPGPVSYAPSLPPLPAQPPIPDVSVNSPPPSSLSPPAIASPPPTSRKRPLVIPNSSAKISIAHSLCIALMIFIVPLYYMI